MRNAGSLLAALIEREAWLGQSGFKTPAHWLNYACGIDLGAAREKIRVARCLSTLPKIDEAFRLGTISYSKVRAMTRCATPEKEEVLLMFAQHGTAQHVEQLVRIHQKARRLHSPEQDRIQYESRELNWYTDEDGMLVLNPHYSPQFNSRASRCRPGGPHGLRDGAGVVDTTSSRIEGVRFARASRSAAAVEGW